ncbi:MAG TPA: RidA family protein [Acetobacteraceae bacterium]|nr:RidA family protein [Acetobacteraceae bacterium]
MIDERLAALKVELPPFAEGLGDYAPWTRVGSLVSTSGQFPWLNGELAYVGRIGETISRAEGYAAARLCALNAIAQLRNACGGDLGRVRSVVRVEGQLFCTPGHVEPAGVLDGASHLINDVFRERGRHSRAVTGVASMPLGSSVLLYVHAEIA